MLNDSRLADSFWEKVQVEPIKGCWIWTGGLTSSGYGPHRRTYERLVGEIPDGLEIDHTCQVRACQNPDHFELVTPEENKRRQGTRVTHCKRGHLYTAETTRIKPNGTRNCKTCHAEDERRRRLERKGSNV